MITEETVPMQAPRQSRREKFTKKQTDEAPGFGLLENGARVITDAVAPLAVEVREQSRPLISGFAEASGSQRFASSLTALASTPRMTSSILNGE